MSAHISYIYDVSEKIRNGCDAEICRPGIHGNWKFAIPLSERLSCCKPNGRCYNRNAVRKFPIMIYVTLPALEKSEINYLVTGLLQAR